MLTVGSLFAGIGGIELGLERTGGFKTIWQVESDEYARRVLEKHWPDVRRWDDVRTFPPDETWERPDLICGGFPCQDISKAGRQDGIDGERSGLWSEYARIIGVVRPRFVLVENVAALLSDGMGRVVGDLATLRYDAEWDCFPAVAFGANHERDRVFIVAYPQGDGFQISRATNKRRDNSTSASKRFRTEFGRNNSSEGTTTIADTDGARLAQRQGKNTGRARSIFGAIPERSKWWEFEPDVVRVVHGISNRVDRIKSLGNAVVPQVAQWIGERILEAVRQPYCASE